MKITLSVWFVCLLAFFQSPAVPAPGRAKLEQVGEVQMVLHHDRGPRPYFRVDLNLVNAAGAPIPIPIPKNGADLTKLIEIEKDGKTFNPFYVHVKASGAGDGQGQSGARQPSDAQQPSREVLLLVDVSGSMCLSADGTGPRDIKTACDSLDRGGTRLDAAKEAAEQLLTDFEQGVDSIAVASFESHGVARGIRDAKFVSTSAEARAQIRALPRPSDQSRTALYSAVIEAVNVMKERAQREGATRRMLVVLSDGDNYVRKDKGDDQALLDRKEDIGEVKRVVSDAKLTTFTIRFGGADAELTRVLSDIAYPSTDNYSAAESSQKLKSELQRRRLQIATAMRITFHAEDEKDYRNIKNEVRFKVRFKSPLPEAVSGEMVWRCGINGCVKQGDLDRAEQAALIEPEKTTSLWRRMLQSLMILGGFSVLLAALWFGPPMLLWPRPAMLSIPGQAARLARAGEAVVRQRGGQRPPEGGRPPGRGANPPRTRTDATVVFDGGRGHGRDRGGRDPES